MDHRSPNRARIARSMMLSALASALALVMLAGPALADGNLDVEVSLDGRDVSELDANAPLVLDPDAPIEVIIDATNPGSDEVFVRSVRLRSKVIGLTFLAYETRVDVPVAANGAATLAFELDLLDLRSQATGLLPAEVELLDAERESVAVVPLTVDVQGSLWSVYGAFGLIIIAITALSIVLLLVRLRTGRLPANRWARAIQFAGPGIGLGLVLTIGLSTLRIFSPAPSLWLTLVGGLGAAGLALGYLSPTPGGDDVVDLADVHLAVSGGDAGAGSAASTSRETRQGCSPPAVERDR